MQFWAPSDDADDDPDLDLWMNEDGNSSREDLNHDLIHLISFRLSMSAPLLLVSKDIHFEVARLLDNLRKLLASQIHLQRVKEPTQAFLDVASRSRFVIVGGSVEIVFLVKHLPDSIKPLVKEIAFTLQTVDDAGQLWGDINGGTGSYVTNALRSELPNLRTIAMEVPHQESDQAFWTSEPLFPFYILLLNKHIDTVRLFYGDGLGGGRDIRVYENEFGPRNDAKDPEEIPSWLRGAPSYIQTRTRYFDIIEVPSWTQWMSEPRFLEKQMRARTIEITRWFDRKLGSATYKELVNEHR